MQILIIEPPSKIRQGDQLHRTEGPLHALAKFFQVQAHSGSWFSQQVRMASETVEILILCQAVDVDFLPLLKRRKEKELVTVFELNDDFLGANGDHAVRAFWRTQRVQSTAFSLMREADGLQFSSKGLEKRFCALNDNYQVFANALPCPINSRQKAAPNQSRESLRVGWGGSLAHRDDVMAIIPALSHVMREDASFTLCVMAPREARLWFSDLPAERCEFSAPGSFNDYLDFCRSLHIGLAPLQDSLFNRSRSDGKCLEYAACGVAIVAEAHLAFEDVCVHNKTALTPRGEASWVACIKLLLRDSALRQRLTEAAAQTLETTRHPRLLAARRYAFYQKLKQASKASSSNEDLSRQGSYRRFSLTASESLLLSGLEADSPEATHDAFEKALSLTPELESLPFYRAACSPVGLTRSRLLRAALHRSPQNLHAALLVIGDALEQRDIQDAQETLSRWAWASPFAVYQEIAGRVFEASGDDARALQAFLRALGNDFDHRPAFFAALRLLIKTKRIREAEALMALGGPHLLADAMEVSSIAELLATAGRPRAARRYLTKMSSYLEISLEAAS